MGCYSRGEVHATGGIRSLYTAFKSVIGVGWLKQIYR